MKYFSTVEGLIVAEKNGNLLSVKANEERFDKSTELVVGTLDGRFYNYEVYYADRLPESTYVAGTDSLIHPYTIRVNGRNDVHLVFPEQISYVDFGSDKIEVANAGDLLNLLRVKTVEPFDFESNITVRTIGNNYFCFNVNYDESAVRYSFSLQGKREILLDKTELTDDSRRIIGERVKGRGRNLWGMGVKRNKIDFSLHNIFIRDNKLILKMDISNESNLTWDIDYLKFYIVDKKTGKKTASQEQEVIPLFIEDYKPFIAGKKSLRMIVCFEKFTIPDDKYFIIEMNEKDGGRHISYKLGNKAIIDAENL